MDTDRFSWALTALGASSSQWNLRRDKSGIRAGRPKGVYKAVSEQSLAYGCVERHIYKQEATGHLGVVSFLQFLDRTVEPKLQVESYLIIDVGFPLYSKMPMTRQDRGKDKQVDIPAREGMSKSPPD